MLSSISQNLIRPFAADAIPSALEGIPLPRCSAETIVTGASELNFCIHPILSGVKNDVTLPCDRPIRPPSTTDNNFRSVHLLMSEENLIEQTIRSAARVPSVRPRLGEVDR